MLRFCLYYAVVGVFYTALCRYDIFADNAVVRLTTAVPAISSQQAAPKVQVVTKTVPAIQQFSVHTK